RDFQDAIAKKLSTLGLPHELNNTQVAELVIKALIKHFRSFKNATGIVIAGYGTQEYFPGFIEYECHGFLSGRLIWEKKDQRQINVDVVSFVKPFAIRDMVNTFLLGFSSEVMAKTEEQAEKEF